MGDPSPAPRDAPVATGVAGFDDVLGGGFVPHRLYLIEGDSGAGKTTLGLHFALEGARAGEKVLYVTLSETAEELADAARSHGWSLDGVQVAQFVPSAEELDPEAQVTMFHLSEVQLGETTQSILAEFERTRPTRLVLDSLSELRLLAQDALRYRHQVLALKQLFTGKRCTVLLPDEPEASRTDLNVRTLVHGVVELEHLAVEFGPERRRLRVVKLRGTGYRGGYHDFRIVRGGLEVFPRLVASEHVQGLPA